jgi:hypothetical protein
MKPNELISIIASNIGDENLVLLNREMYIQFVNDVAMDIWKDSKATHTVREYALPNGAMFFDLPEDDIIEFVSLQTRVKTIPDLNVGIYSQDQDVIPRNDKPALQQIEEGIGTWRNIGQRWGHSYYTLELRNGRYRVQTAIPFSGDLILTAYAVIHSPRYVYPVADDYFDPVLGVAGTPNDNDRIWEVLRSVFIEGGTYRAANRALNFTKSSSHASIAAKAEQRYHTYLKDAIHYIHSLKDSTIGLAVEPFRYCEE